MENVRLRMKMQLVSNPKTCSKLINKPNFKSMTIYNENLCAVQLHLETHTFDKPIYVGMSVLDISKTLMYEFHYDVMREHYGDSLQLLYMDTGKYINLYKKKCLIY